MAVIVAAASCRQIFRIEPVQLAVDAGGDGRVGDGPPIDNGVPSEAGVCPAVCTSCDLPSGTCVIDCNLTTCNNVVKCPAGFACQVKCDVNNACHNGVDCTNATSCDISCSGSSSCKNVQCGPGACKVACTGMSSCSNNITCGSSCACDVDCSGQLACPNGVSCTSVACTLGSGCTSMPVGCHSCM